MDPLSIFAAAQERPDAVCIVHHGRELSYRSVAERVARTVRWLVGLETRPTSVAVVAALRVETVVLFYALFALGIPVVLIHPRARPEERRRLAGTAGVARVIDESWSDLALPEHPGGIDPTELTAVDPESPLAVLFTSGTSGAPKGVVLSRRAFMASAAGSAANLGWRDDDRWLLCMPLAHVGGLSVVVRCLLARKPMVLSPWTGDDLDGFLGMLERDRVTILSLVPTMLVKILDERPAYRFPEAVRVVMLGGDATSPNLIRRSLERTIPIVTTYGMTEACSQVATHMAGEPVSTEMGVGRPLPGVEIRIVDGEIQLRGATLMSGYHPVAEGRGAHLHDGWFSTGDIGSFDEAGRLHVLGRKTDRIITGGENVDPAEVENAIARCEGVAAACVFGVQDDKWGQIVAVAIVPSLPHDAALLERVADHAASQLADFKRPRRFAVVDDFVHGATGKLDRASTGRSLEGRLVSMRAHRR